VLYKLPKIIPILVQYIYINRWYWIESTFFYVFEWSPDYYLNIFDRIRIDKMSYEKKGHESCTSYYSGYAFDYRYSSTVQSYIAVQNEPVVPNTLWIHN